MSEEIKPKADPKRLSYAALVRAVKSAHVPSGGKGYDAETAEAESARFRMVASAIGDELTKIGHDKAKFLRDVWAG